MATKAILRAVLLLAAVIHLATPRAFDMTHKQLNTTLVFPGNPKLHREITFEGDFVPGVYAATGFFTTAEHTGTHLDAPSHFAKGGLSLEDVPIDRTFGEGVLIDCSREVEANRDYLVTVQKLQDWERSHGRIPDGAVAVFNFGMAKYVSENITKFVGSNDTQNLFSFRFPAISAEAGEWLHYERNVKMLAVDSLTPDPFQINGGMPMHMPNHELFLGAGKLIVENVVIPADLPSRGFTFYASPIRIQGATGTPVRAFAIVQEGDNFRYGENSAGTAQTSWLPILASGLVVSVITMATNGMA